MKAGAAQVDITPPAGVDLCGFAMREQPSVGVLDPLFAKAVYVVDGKERLLWVHCDLIAVSDEMVGRFRRWADAKHGMQRAQVLLSATHTHSGPATIRLRGAGTRDPVYLQTLDEKLQEVAERAIVLAEPCSLVGTEAMVDLAVDRCGPSTAHVDKRAAATGFRREDGTFIAVVANCAVHPVALNHTNRLVSADLFGAAADSMAKALPGRPVVLMTNGACGNLNPPKDGVSQVQVLEWGGLIADALAPGLRDGQSQRGRLHVARRVESLPSDWLDAAGVAAAVNRVFESVPDEGFGSFVRNCAREWGAEILADLEQGRASRTHAVEMHVVRLGEVTFLGVNVEIFSLFAERLWQESGWAKTYTVGYANGDLGYLCPRGAYDDGGYEADMAHLFYGGFRFRAGAFEELVDAAVAFVIAVAQRAAAEPLPCRAGRGDSFSP